MQLFVQIFANLKAAVKLIVFRERNLVNFKSSTDAVAAMATLFLLVAFLCEFYSVLPNPHFNVYGVTMITLHVSLLAVVAYLLSKVVEGNYEFR